MSQIWIIPANHQDMEWLYICRNQPELYRNGYNARPVSWREHQEWFGEVMDNPESNKIFIIMRDKTQVGMVRLEKNPFDEAEISIHVLPSAQGVGIGTKAIELGSQWALKEWAVNCVAAYVFKGNDGSIRAFEKAGYIEDGEWSNGPILTWREENEAEKRA